MTIHFQRELEKIKKQILSLGSMVEDRVRRAIKAIDPLDVKAAQSIMDTDYEIDEMEVDVEEECLKVLALYQPVAIDLRFLIAVIKINNDLERIADEAVNIAQRILTLSKKDRPDYVFDFSPMAEKVQKMLKKSLDALVNLDSDTAFAVLTMDDEVDALHREAYGSIKESLGKHPEMATFLLNHYLISRHLERLADHATNIAEEVVYLVEGEIVRHEEF
jgi:phosphate transport system protein